MIRALLLLACVAFASSLRVAAPANRRTSGINMGLAVGDKFPASALKTCGISGRKACVFFYGADDAPSCSKQISAFERAAAEFKDAGIAVVGVRNPAGVKDETSTEVKLVVDVGDAMREEIGIEKDLFGLLGGRETYVLDGSGTVVSVHNNQCVQPPAQRSDRTTLRPHLAPPAPLSACTTGSARTTLHPHHRLRPCNAPPVRNAPPAWLRALSSDSRARPLPSNRHHLVPVHSCWQIRSRVARQGCAGCDRRAPQEPGGRAPRTAQGCTCHHRRLRPPPRAEAATTQNAPLIKPI